MWFRKKVRKSFGQWSIRVSIYRNIPEIGRKKPLNCQKESKLPASIGTLVGWMQCEQIRDYLFGGKCD
jgi:hypothetical protein